MRTCHYKPGTSSSLTWRVSILMLVAIWLTGCGSEFGATASGTVTLDGDPVTPGLVTFAPENSTLAPAVSDLDSGGRYKLSTNKKPGIAPGKYRVAIQAFRLPDLPKGQRSFDPAVPLVPEKYLNVNTSGLEFTIEPGSNAIDVALVTD